MALDRSPQYIDRKGLNDKVSNEVTMDLYIFTQAT
jgi:hypothetical protein